MFDPLRRELDHEELFVDRYDLLLRAALRVTEGDRQAAEDLVQDAFIRFTVVQPPLQDVAQLDAYFYAMLRNMHTSRVRRAQVAKVSLSILDFDSLDIGFEALDAPGRLEARQAVRAACEYGCVRRHSSKIGSIFLLRFFHGYLPSEIARIARLSAAMIDDQLFRARREVKLFVEQPGHLTFIDSARAAAALRACAREDDDDGSEEALVRQLRARMFSERHASCWSKSALRDLYAAPRTDSLARETLAAIAGCPVCLDEVNAIVNIPRLASRWPTDTLGPGTRGGSGGTGSDRSPSRLASARRRASDVFEHRPLELRVHVNGFELGSHTIGSRRSELSLASNIGEPVALVELFSEQGLCLLFLDASPPPGGPVRQRRRVDLSAGRYAEVEVVFGGPWPTVRACYVDPGGGEFALAAPERDFADERRESLDPDVIALVDPTIASQIAPPFAPLVPATASWLGGAWTALSWPLRLFGLRPAPAYTLLAVLCTWLLFWTPGLEVSAAERIADAVKRFVIEWAGGKTAPEPSRPTPTAPALVEPRSALPVPAAPVVRPAAVPRLTGARRAALELRAIMLLQRVDAYLGQEVSFGPTEDTRIVVRAAVDGDERKHAVEKALASLAGARDVGVVIEDLREVAGRLRSAAAPVDTPTQAFEFVKDQYPMFEPLRAYFHAQRAAAIDPAEINQAEIDREVRRFTLRVLDHSRRASQHAWALQYVADRFPPPALRAASADTRDLWRSIVREHARGYLQEVALIRTALQPVASTTGLEDAAGLNLAPGLDVDRAVAPGLWSSAARLLDLQKIQDGAIQGALTMQRDGNGVNLVQTAAFWRLIDETTALAARIAGESASPAAM